MGANMYYKKYIEKLINSNPTTITITRTTKVDDGYGGYTETEIEHNERVTFYDKKATRQTVNESGVILGYSSSNVEKALVKGDADIIKGDIIKANGREYRVLFVNPYLDICKQIELEVIG